MSDLITRWDAAEVVYKALRMPAPDYKKDPIHDSMSLAIAMVREIPSAQQWVPVSEDLPKDEEIKLVTCKTKKGILNVNRAYYMDGHWHGSGSMSNVIAWMDPPEPYREVTE